jgi:hypothetical protein
VTLKVAFPALFGIARVKDVAVADNLEHLGDSIQWNVSFTREAHDWEVDVFVSFFQVLHSVKVSTDSEDKLWWVSSKKGVFKVKSSFYFLVSSNGSHFPGKVFGTIKFPQGLPSLCGSRFLARFSPWTTSGNDMLS